MTGQLKLFDWPADANILAETTPRPEVCNDCSRSIHGEWYMVHDDLWPLAKDGGFLCISCLEGRLGRRLTPVDFKDVPANDPGHPDFGRVHRSHRFLDRLGWSER